MSGLNPGKYLGEYTIPHNMSSQEAALYFIGFYGGIDGSHHKAWVLDQVARILHGTEVLCFCREWKYHTEHEYRLADEPTQAYLDWVLELRGQWDEENDCFEYIYDEGIAP